MRKFLWIAISFSIFVLAGCVSEAKKTACPPPKEGFTEADVIGTWVATHLNFSRDTLIIREDGKYKQIIHLEIPLTDYESDWLPWSIEHDENGLPYLHMEEMRLCAYAPDLISCDQIGGSGEDESLFNGGYWYDFCKDEMVLMQDEGVLIVVGVPEQFAQPPKGIRLRLLMYTESSWVYELQPQ
jgi:hypothetical protein